MDNTGCGSPWLARDEAVNSTQIVSVHSVRADGTVVRLGISSTEGRAITQNLIGESEAMEPIKCF